MVVACFSLFFFIARAAVTAVLVVIITIWMRNYLVVLWFVTYRPFVLGSVRRAKGREKYEKHKNKLLFDNLYIQSKIK